jgi:Fic family protein
MKIIDKRYFEQYQLLIGNELKTLVERFDFAGKSDDLVYQTQASAVYSSNIEGNTIDLNSFMNYKLLRSKLKPQKELKEIEDLISAYSFAQQNTLNEKNLLKAHQILSKQFLIRGLRGKYRNDKVGVFGHSGLVYLAIEAEYTVEAVGSLFEEISSLLTANLSLEETFYFASLIHLRLAHIHPFADGNGRAARLLEKWFLAQKLNRQFWTMPSEKYYKEHQQEYYDHINLGVNYYELDYAKCLPFLMMLPNCLKQI